MHPRRWLLWVFLGATSVACNRDWSKTCDGPPRGIGTTAEEASIPGGAFIMGHPLLAKPEPAPGFSANAGQ